MAYIEASITALLPTSTLFQGPVAQGPNSTAVTRSRRHHLRITLAMAWHLDTELWSFVAGLKPPASKLHSVVIAKDTFHIHFTGY